MLKFDQLVYCGSQEAMNCENSLPMKSKVVEGARIFNIYIAITVQFR